MPLSEYEQRVLNDLERDLGADPKISHAMSGSSRSRGRLTWAVLGVLIGLGIVLAGAVSAQPVVGIAGFALMTFAALWGMMSPRGDSKDATSSKSKGGTPAPKSKPADQSFMRRVEERFERRREQGDL